VKLVVSEKPSVGTAYAHALGVKEKKDGCFEGNGYIITWCVGHLVEFANADAYDERYKKWSISDLPIIPREWKYVVSADKNKQYQIVKKLLNDSRVDELIFATDAGREGELIFRLVYEYANCKKPIKRLWLSSMEEKAIVEAFGNLRDGADYFNLYQSALCRAKSDWAVGINATRLFTKLYNKRLNVGCVQTPTLAMICERGTAIADFVKQKYYNIHLKGIAVLEKIKEQSEAERIKSECDGNTAVVRSVKREKKTVSPPRLFDLTTLQREANRVYGFTAQQTLDYTQSLYEMRLVTYPRTDSQFLTDDMSGTANEIIKVVLNVFPQFSGVSYTPDVSKVINGKKVTDHHAIIPTVEIAKAKLDAVPDGERKILSLIANKLLCATADKHEYEAVTAEIVCNNYTFIAKGKTVISDGWKAFSKRDDEDGEIVFDIPELTEGQTFENAACNITEHFTSPPKQYTEDTLLSAMERARQRETDSGSAEDLPERAGLGTPATRASIIEKLIKSGYVTREKKNLVATADGANLIAIMPDIIKSAKMTADWEHVLSLIAKDKQSADDFMEQIENFVNFIISSAKENVKQEFVAPQNIVPQNFCGEKVGVCPRCKGDVCETPKAYACKCGFIIWKNNKFFESARKAFTKDIVTALLKDGEIALEGLYSERTGKTYDATVCLEDTGTWVNFKLDFTKKKKGDK